MYLRSSQMLRRIDGFIVLLLVLCASIPTRAQSTTFLYDLIYKELLPQPCIRFLNATGTVGCSSRPLSGVLYHASSQTDIDSFDTVPQDTYAVVLPFELLNRENINRLFLSKKVGGLLVIEGDRTSSAVLSQIKSHDSTCPNCEFGMYASDPNRHNWSPQANSLMFDNQPFPIFSLFPDTPELQTTIQLVLDRARENKNSGFSSFTKHSIEFDAYMAGAYNAEVCLRREMCSPVGGFSVYATPSQRIEENKPIILLSAAIDSRSIFRDLSQGAGTMNGAITLMAVADALSKSPTSPSAFNKHIIYTFFNAEAFGNIGSSRFVDDLSSNTCSFSVPLGSDPVPQCPYYNVSCSNPCFIDLNFTSIKIDKIESIIELNQLGNIGSDKTDLITYLHVDESSDLNNELVQTLNNVGKNVASNATLNRNGNFSSGDLRSAIVNGKNLRLPPSSAQSFLKKRKIPAVVISDFQSEYTNRFFGTPYDDYKAFNPSSIQHLCYTATSVARAVYGISQDIQDITNIPPEIQANCTLISELTDCILKNNSCSLMAQVSKRKLNSRPSTQSTQFFYGVSVPLFPSFLYTFMANVTATSRGKACKSEDDCSPDEDCLFSTCLLSSTHYHFAYPTGLKYSYDNRVWKVTDPSQPTWVQSKHRRLGLRLFKSTSVGTQVVELVVGLGVVLISVGIVWWWQRWVGSRIKVD